MSGRTELFIVGLNAMQPSQFYISEKKLSSVEAWLDPSDLSNFEPIPVKMLDGALENIVFLELKRRGYDVYIGKNEAKEIDFVAERNGERIYVQVCVRLPEDSDREVGNLMEIKDHYPKYVVTTDPLDVGNENGIKILHLADFLLQDAL